MISIFYGQSYLVYVLIGGTIELFSIYWSEVL